MKLKFIASILLLLLFIQPAFANHGVDAMGDGIALLFAIGFILLILSVVSIVVSYKAYKRNKTSLKIISTILSIPTGVCSIIFFRMELVLPGFIALAFTFINMFLIASAKNKFDDK